MEGTRKSVKKFSQEKPKPYDRPQKSLLGRVTTTVREMFTPSFLKFSSNNNVTKTASDGARNGSSPTMNVTHPQQVEVEMDGYVATFDSSIMNDELTTPHNLIKSAGSLQHPVNHMADKLNASGVIPAPSLTRPSCTDNTFSLTNDSLSLFNTPQFKPTSQPLLQSSARKSLSNGLKSVATDMGSNEPEFKRRRQDIAQTPIECQQRASNQSTLLWSDDHLPVPSSRPTIGSSNPGFTISTFCKSVEKTRNEMDVLSRSYQESPFYRGKTTYGGASAYSKLSSGSRYQLIPSAPYHRVKATPVVPANGRTVMMSTTARRIYEALERFSPTNERDQFSRGTASAEDVPLLTSSTMAYRRNTVQPSASTSLESRLGPPVKETLTPSQNSYPIAFNPRSEDEIMDQSQPHGTKLLVADKRVTGAGGGGKIKHDHSKHYLRNRESEEVDQNIGYNLPTNVSLPLIKNGNFMSTSISSLPVSSCSRSVASTVSAVLSQPSPAYPKPLGTTAATSVTSRTSSLSAATSAVQASLVSVATSVSVIGGSIMSPIAAGGRVALPASVGFQFSKPAGIVERSASDKQAPTTFEFCQPLSKTPLPSGASVMKPTVNTVSVSAASVLSSATSGSSLHAAPAGKLSDFKFDLSSAATKAKPSTTSSPTSKTAVELKQGSCMDLLRNVSASAPVTSLSGEKNLSSPVASAGGVSSNSDSEPVPLSQLFKERQAPGSWTCSECYVINKAVDTICLACSTPKPGCSVPATSPSQSSSGSGFAFKFGTTTGAVTDAPVLSAASGFKFGQSTTSTPSQSLASGFTFGQSKVNPAALSSAGGFSFGQSTATVSSVSLTGSSCSTASSAGFKFAGATATGTPVTTQSSFAASGFAFKTSSSSDEISERRKSLGTPATIPFKFGDSSVASATSGISFSSSVSTAPVQSSAIFGSFSSASTASNFFGSGSAGTLATTAATTSTAEVPKSLDSSPHVTATVSSLSSAANVVSLSSGAPITASSLFTFGKAITTEPSQRGLGAPSLAVGGSTSAASGGFQIPPSTLSSSTERFAGKQSQPGLGASAFSGTNETSTSFQTSASLSTASLFTFGKGPAVVQKAEQGFGVGSGATTTSASNSAFQFKPAAQIPGAGSIFSSASAQLAVSTSAAILSDTVNSSVTASSICTTQTSSVMPTFGTVSAGKSVAFSFTSSGMVSSAVNPVTVPLGSAQSQLFGTGSAAASADSGTSDKKVELSPFVKPKSTEQGSGVSAAPNFNFSSSSAPQFSFGTVSTTTTSANPSQPASSLFTFGKSASVTSGSTFGQTSSTTFGQSTSSGTSATGSLPAISAFGSTTSAFGAASVNVTQTLGVTSTAASAFTFNNAVTTQQASVFQFGQTTQSGSTSMFGLSSFTNTSSAFGTVGSLPGSSSSVFSQPASLLSTTVGFGTNTTQPSVAPAFSFKPSVSTTASSFGFSFGQMQNTASTAPFGQTQPVTQQSFAQPAFGNSQPSFGNQNAFGGQTTGLFAFGASTSTVAPSWPASNNNFTFSASGAASTGATIGKRPGPPGDDSSAKKPTAFGQFGMSGNTASIFAAPSAANSAPSFGSTAPSAGFNFGSTAPPAWPGQAAPTNQPVQLAVPSTFNFGQPAAAAPQQPLFQFGGQPPAADVSGTPPPGRIIKKATRKLRK